jgi:hypothetical protein
MVLTAHGRFACKNARAFALAAGLTLGSFGTTLFAQQREDLPDIPDELKSVRAALDKYHDPMAAIQDGYLSTVGCVSFTEPAGPGRLQYPPGGMGVHFLNPSLIGSKLDPLHPQVLIYEPSGERLRLVAAEWFVPLSTGVTERPVIFDKPMDGPMEGHHPVMPSSLHHYDLHVWLWKPNPAGLFSPTNPALECPAAAYTFRESPPRIVPGP